MKSLEKTVSLKRNENKMFSSKIPNSATLLSDLDPVN